MANTPAVVCAQCDLEFVSAVANRPAIEAVESVYRQHLIFQHAVEPEHALTLAKAWACIELDKLK